MTECRAEGGITLARFRDLVGTGRRDAQLLLERLDADGVTRRVGRAPCAPSGGASVVSADQRAHSGSSSIPTPSATRVT